MIFKPRQKGLGKDNFIKLADKGEISGFFKGAPYQFRKHWKGAQSIECSGAECAVCLSDPENRSNFSFRINFVTTINGQWVAKIFEGGARVFDDLVALDAKVNLETTPVEISRNGTKKDTRYTFFPMMREPVTKEMKEKVDEVKLLPLVIEQQEEAVTA